MASITQTVLAVIRNNLQNDPPELSNQAILQNKEKIQTNFIIRLNDNELQSFGTNARQIKSTIGLVNMTDSLVYKKPVVRKMEPIPYMHTDDLVIKLTVSRIP